MKTKMTLTTPTTMRAHVFRRGLALALAALATGAAFAAQAAGWRYGDEAGAKTARIDGTLQGGGAVTLVFRDDPTWGQTAMVEGLRAAAECPSGCRVGIAVDGKAGGEVPASRPKGATPKLSLRQPRELWRKLAGARELVLTLPAGPDGAPRAATFTVSGVDAARMGWK